MLSQRRPPMRQTVLLTGVTGFIARRIALDLLNAGHTVRGSLRSAARGGGVRDGLRPHLDDPAALERLSFVELDLADDAGWDAAMAGVDTLMHTASPFPMRQPEDEDQIIRPAVDGTRRALTAAAAAGVGRVVLTSSMVAVMHTDAPEGRAVTEDDWTDPAHRTANAYVRSKTLAERAAWEIAEAHPDMSLIAINPGLVLGRPVDDAYGTSLAVIERIMAAKDPMQPDVGFPVVHLSDVSALHLAALDTPAMAGHRHLAAESFWTMPEIARLLTETYPDRRIKTGTAPGWMLRVLALFDREVRTVLPTVGFRVAIDPAPTEARAGHRMIPARDAILEAAAFIAAKG
ncbi:NAD-dependent epimerase/dehydratase family protein [Rhodobacteraceae bacterium CCMM004]|nr:NAD-dependent epimerase/dehydratase family protein [Rhodobacteraceae bacterium CCMM004]